MKCHLFPKTVHQSKFSLQQFKLYLLQNAATIFSITSEITSHWSLKNKNAYLETEQDRSIGIPKPYSGASSRRHAE